MITYRLYEDMLKQPHLLIAGATGSGKSVVENALIYTAMLSGNTEYILIDPKRVELIEYKDTVQCVYYASEPDTMIYALNVAMDITEKRYKEMQKQRLRLYNGLDLYVFIDEFADLMTTNKKAVQPIVQRLAQIGRAARVHLVICTQTPISKVLPTEIKVNFDARVALRTRSAQDSRNILGFKGCETLPRYGQGYYMTPEGIQLYSLPMIPEEDRQQLLQIRTQHKSMWQQICDGLRRKKR